jgi:enoyl-CoA hydratase/carnithine racemase
MSFDNFLLERGGAVAVLIINRPHVLNPLNSSTIDQWPRAVVDLTHDAAVRAVIKRKANFTGR